ncbi:lysophospholipid acyltransferase family protein [Celeribacter arenosi]|uniref:Lysophospholipid acyltransferase family protein n=2 Tax=Celeribacter arenosi TaxID=792649 RepID=A0ABP7KCC9_9RHOB
MKRSDRDGTVIEGSRAHWVENLVTRGLLSMVLALPYRWRVPFMGWLMSRVVGPLAGYNKRVRANLNFVHPELDEAAVSRLAREVTDNAGRTMIEIYSGREFIERMKDVEFRGAGAEQLFAARDAGRPVVLVTGHFGNYDVPRAALNARGYPLGALYNPMKNPFFNAHYERTIATIAEPLFARGLGGYGRMLRYLAQGNMVGILIDLHVKTAPYMDFFGKPARTALSAGEMAIKYDALLVPIYGVRGADGLSFHVEVEAPIEKGSAEEMTQALNDSLAAIVARHMGQWFWIHRRWKPDQYPPEIAAQVAGEQKKGGA